jgi:hypothetical protein
VLSKLAPQADAPPTPEKADEAASPSPSPFPRQTSMAVPRPTPLALTPVEEPVKGKGKEKEKDKEETEGVRHAWVPTPRVLKPEVRRPIDTPPSDRRQWRR